MMKYLGLMPGSVSIFGLINDLEKHVHVFLDKKLLTADRISFHPNINTASVVISFSDFEKFLKWKGNSFEYIDMD
jgi:Ala-tRNA(Pro) deacylase